jgi:hypothetical protein
MAGHRSSWPPDAPDDLFPPEIKHLLGTAQRTISQHVNRHGHCADCGSIWPCHSAELAAFTLDAL